jgi:hypothetical protein
MSPRKSLGDWGESFALDYFNKLGYNVRKGIQGIESDLVAIDAQGTLRNIEVKTSQRGADHKWRATLIKKGHTDHRKSNLVIMLCVHRGMVTLFLIPTEAIKSRSHIVITSDPKTYNGQFAQYRVGVKVI